eukprot:6193191-Ditylum_brightwellii.AAC.1
MGGQNDSNKSGLFHAVVNATTAGTIAGEQFQNAEKKTKIIRSYSTSSTVTNTDGENISIKTWWVELGIDKNVKPSKFCNPTKEDIITSSFLKFPDGYDTYAILGEQYNPIASYHLLQLTFEQMEWNPQGLVAPKADVNLTK